MKVKQIMVKMPLVHPFTTSFGTQRDKYAILIKISDEEGNIGWGETPLERQPGYCYETTETAWYIQKEFLIPELLKLDTLTGYEQLSEPYSKIRGHEFAKSGIEAAINTYVANKTGKSLGDLYGSVRSKVPTGVSIGIQPDIDKLLTRISTFLDQGYHRIKIKIQPGWDLEVLKRIRTEFGDIKLMVDANSAYSLNDVELFKAMDRYELMMIEQPLHYQDVLQHKKLQREIDTPVCLDESIHTVTEAIEAIEQECAQIINIKPGRVGGYMNAVEIARKLGKNKVWCGGMLESGINRVHNLFLQAREEFSIPGDTSGSNRYFEQDIIAPAVKVDDKGYITLLHGKGLGVEVLEDKIEDYSIRQQLYML